MDVKGHKIELSDERHVFVGTVKDDTHVYLQFRNKDRFTEIKISSDALVALRKLLEFKGHGTPLTYPDAIKPKELSETDSEIFQIVAKLRKVLEKKDASK